MDWLGDIGGLIEALSYLFHVVFAPFWKFSYSSFMMSSLFRVRPPYNSQLKQALKALPRVPNISVLFYYTCCWSKRRKNYQRQLLNSQSELNSEMDFKKFIERQRMQTTMLLSLLSGRQTFCAMKLSRMTI